MAGRTRQFGAATPVMCLVSVVLLALLTVPAGSAHAVASGGGSEVTITEFDTGLAPVSEPRNLTRGPDGNVWFTESGADRIGRVTPYGEVTEFSAGITHGSLPWDIATGPDGNLWFTETDGQRIGRITPEGAVTEFPAGVESRSPRGIAAGPDGNIWFTTYQGTIVRMTAEGLTTEFSVRPSVIYPPYLWAERIVSGPDGNLWFVVPALGAHPGFVGRMSTAGEVTLFGLSSFSDPGDLAFGADGNLWFTLGHDGIGRMTPTGDETVFPYVHAYARGITAAPDGTMWFTENWTYSPGPYWIGRITAQGEITEFSAGLRANQWGITTGADGNLWFSEPEANKLGRVDLATLGVTVEEFHRWPLHGDFYDGITAGPDGNMWFTMRWNGIGRITPQGEITEFTDGITPDSYPFEIAGGPDGNVWFTERSAGQIGRITPDGTVTEFAASAMPKHPVGIATGPDGNVWFTMFEDTVARMTPNGALTEFTEGITPGSIPAAISTGPDGNMWFTEPGGNRIARITLDGTVTEFSGLTPNALRWGGGTWQGITAGPDGNIWFNEWDAIGRITPHGQVTEFRSHFLTPGSWLTDITSGPDGNLWFTEFTGAYFTSPTGRVGRITPSGYVSEFFDGLLRTSSPYMIASGPDGNIWFTEQQHEDGEDFTPLRGAIGRIRPPTIAPDTTAPTLSLPPDMTLVATDASGAPAAFTVTAKDDTDPAPLVSCTPSSGTVFGLGTTTVTCTATDAAGNSSTGAFAVSVRYRWDGFLQPVNDTAHSVGLDTSVFKAGSTVPVKCQLKTAGGTPLQGVTPPVLISAEQRGPMSQPVDEFVYSATPTDGTAFRWDADISQYRYNWKTATSGAGYWWVLTVALPDGTQQAVTIGLR